jgi:hypothetical protein
MGTAAQACTLRDWAALISAAAWPGLIVFVFIFFRTTLAELLSRISTAKALGGEVEFRLTRLAETTKTTTEALLSTDADFDRIRGLLDWNKVGGEVMKWASEHKALNPADMGLNNFRRFLFDTGLPGGQSVTLEWEPNGTLKYQ